MKTISEIPKSWIQDEIESQERFLKALLNATHYKDVIGYQEAVDMRIEFIEIANKKLLEVNKKLSTTIIN